MLLTKCRSGLLGLGRLVAAAPARADVVLPVNYAITGFAFTCDQYVGANCLVSGGGSTVTFFNNGGSLSITATTFSGSFVESNASAVSFPVLTFSSTVTGPFTTLPLGASNEDIVRFVAFLQFTTPDGTLNTGFDGGFYPDPGRATGHISVYGGLFNPPSSSLPNGLRASASVTTPPNITFGSTNASGTIFGTASIVPEPSTIVLSASGLGFIGLVSMRRRRLSV